VRAGPSTASSTCSPAIATTWGATPASIEKTLSSRLAPGESAEQFADRCAQLATIGIDHVVLITTGPWTLEDLDVISGAARLVGDE